MLKKLLNLLPARVVYAHCDLPCGVYDPAQARIEAQSVYNIMKKFAEAKDDDVQNRALIIKEQRAQLVKEHLWVLWTDYFKSEHLEKVPDLHDLMWRATKAAGDAKKSTELSVGQALIDAVDAVGQAFEATKDGYKYQAVVDNMKAQAI